MCGKYVFLPITPLSRKRISTANNSKWDQACTNQSGGHDKHNLEGVGLLDQGEILAHQALVVLVL